MKTSTGVFLFVCLFFLFGFVIFQEMRKSFILQLRLCWFICLIELRNDENVTLNNLKKYVQLDSHFHCWYSLRIYFVFFLFVLNLFIILFYLILILIKLLFCSFIHFAKLKNSNANFWMLEMRVEHVCVYLCVCVVEKFVQQQTELYFFVDKRFSINSS